MDGSEFIFQLGFVPRLMIFAFSTYRTSHFTLRDAHVVSGDDCFAFKGNSTYVTVENVYCQNSHGVSVGSLAQYPGVLDIIEHVKVVSDVLRISIRKPILIALLDAEKYNLCREWRRFFKWCSHQGLGRTSRHCYC